MPYSITVIKCQDSNDSPRKYLKAVSDCLELLPIGDVVTFAEKVTKMINQSSANYWLFLLLGVTDLKDQDLIPSVLSTAILKYKLKPYHSKVTLEK